MYAIASAFFSGSSILIFEWNSLVSVCIIVNESSLPSLAQEKVFPLGFFVSQQLWEQIFYHILFIWCIWEWFVTQSNIKETKPHFFFLGICRRCFLSDAAFAALQPSWSWKMVQAIAGNVISMETCKPNGAWWDQVYRMINILSWAHF